VKKHKNLLYNR